MSYSAISVFRDLALILGVVSSLIGFGPQIMDSLDKLVEAKRRNSLYRAYLDYGCELFSNERYSEAVRSFKEALNLQPNNLSVQVWLKKARLLQALDQLQTIDKDDISQLSFEVEFVIKSNPPDIYRYFYVQGNIRYILNDFQGARESYQRALKSKPDYGRALANLGSTLCKLQNYFKAIEMLHEAIAADYINADVYGNLCFALRLAGKNMEAVSTANEGLKKFPANAAIYNELGIALYRLKRMDQSISALKTAYVMTSKKETNLLVQRITNLAYPLADNGRTGDALAYLQTAKDLSPEDPHVHLAFAHCHYLDGKYAKTVASYETLGALGNYPDPHDLVKWAAALEQLNRSKEAARILSMAMEVAINKGQKHVIKNIKSLCAKLGDRQLMTRIEEIENGLKSKTD